MANEPKVGDLAIDLTGMAGFLKDLEPGAMQGMRWEKAGFAEVEAELSGNQEKYGALAGVSAEDLEQVTGRTEKIRQIDAALPVIQKLEQMLRETRTLLVHEREQAVSSIAQQVELKAKSRKDPELRARYQATLDYRSQTAVKAAKTRKKNSKAEDAPPE